MAIALPLQGLASASMLFCASLPAAVAAAHASGAAGQMAAGHDCHTAADDTALPPPAGDLADLSPHSCSACAACAAASALPATAPRLLQPDTVPAVFATLAVSVDRFATDGPDRPPRPRPV